MAPKRLVPLALLAGCVLEDNPDFDGPVTATETAGGASETSLASTTLASTTLASTTSASTSTSTSGESTTLPGTVSATSDATTGGLCGDGVLDGGEACDDGNQTPGDGCEPECTPTCGNGLIDQNELLVEECDDGPDNGLGGGCSTACAIEACPPAFVPCDALADDPTWYESLGVGCQLPPGVDMRKGALLLDKGALESPEPAAWRQLRSFGSYKADPNNYYFQARHGASMLLLSTGVAGVPGVDGHLLEAPGSQATNHDNQNPDMAPLPTPLVTAQGGNPDPFVACLPDKDCSNTLAPLWQALGNNPSIHDLFAARLELQAPRRATGFALDVAYFSAEWQYIDMGGIYRDLFVLWQVSEAFTGNLAFYAGGHLDPASLKAAANQGVLHKGADVELGGTGFENQVGTPWLTIRGRVTAKDELAPRGDVVALHIVLADALDPLVATAVLLDNFRWECDAVACAAPQELAVCTSTSPQSACCGASLPP